MAVACARFDNTGLAEAVTKMGSIEPAVSPYEAVVEIEGRHRGFADYMASIGARLIVAMGQAV